MKKTCSPLQGVFTSSITGNLVVAVTSVSTGTFEGLTIRSFVLFGYFLGAALSSLVSFFLTLSRESRFKMITSLSLLSIEVTLVLFAIIFGLMFEETISRADTSKDNWRVVLIAFILAMSMGCQNILGRESVHDCPNTTVMTAALVGLAYEGAAAFLLCVENFTSVIPRHETDMACRITGRHFQIILTFVIGAISGAFAMVHLSFWSLFIPFALILLVGILQYFQEDRPFYHTASFDPTTRLTVSPTLYSKMETNEPATTSYQINQEPSFPSSATAAVSRSSIPPFEFGDISMATKQPMYY